MNLERLLTLSIVATLVFVLNVAPASSQEVEVSGPGPVLVPPLLEPLDPVNVQIDLGAASSGVSVDLVNRDLGIDVRALTDASGRSRVALPAGQYEVRYVGGAPPPPPPPSDAQVPPLPQVVCGNVVTGDRLAQYINDAANAVQEGKKWSEELARVILGGPDSESGQLSQLAEGQRETETCILESPLTASDRYLITRAEEHLIDCVLADTESLMQDLIISTPLPREWKPPFEPLLEKPTPQKIAARIQTLAEDERYVQQVAQTSRGAAQANQWLRPVVDRNSGRSGQQFMGNCHVTCGQLIGVNRFGWVNQ